MKMLIFTVSDLNYFEKFNLFLKSFILNESNKDNVKYVHFFIYREENEKYKIMKNFLKFFYNYFDLVQLKFIKYNNSNVSIKNYSCHFRFNGFKILSEIYQNYIIIYSDVDAIISNSLHSKLNLFTEDYYFFIRKNEKKNIIINTNNIELKQLEIDVTSKKWPSSILSGVIVIKNNLNGKKLINRLCDEIENVKDKNNWYNDQEILDKVFFECKFKIGILNICYFDLQICNNSILHLCKGNYYPEDRNKWKTRKNYIIKNFNSKQDVIFNKFFYDKIIKKESFKFDSKYYTSLYPDILKHYTLDKAINHWNDHGKKELRVCSADYKIKFNKLKQNALNKYHSENKYFNKFFYELYIKDLPFNFDPQFYVNTYPNVLKWYSIDKAIVHWNDHGKKELLVCSKKYKKLFDELKKKAKNDYSNV